MFTKFSLFLMINFLLTACAGIKVMSHKKDEGVDFFAKMNTVNPQEIELNPGEVRIVKLPINDAPINATLECNSSNFKYSQTETELIFIIAESYFSKLTNYSCYLSTSNGMENFAAEVLKVSVKPKKFPSERLYVDQKKVFLSARDQERVKTEQLMLNEVYKNSSNTYYPTSPFIRPMNTVITSLYGTKRVFNNSKQTQHLGVDFRGRVGSEVKAANSGKVVLVDDLFYTGHTVIIDHGLGLFSVYGHLKEYFLTVGDFVKQADVIGLSGRSGRVTGPHLHWGVKANGNWVDGLYLVTSESAELTYAKFE